MGKKFEMMICKFRGIVYDGQYKYGFDNVDIIISLLHNLNDAIPFELKHIAKNGNEYDFEIINDDNKSKYKYLSAKTTKKDGRVCPQVIGQPSKKKFCDFFGIDLSSDLEQIKNYIVTNVKTLLDEYMKKTFNNCYVLYYNEYKNIMLVVTLEESINWTNYNILFSHNIKNKKWNESSCIKINDITIGEFQIHKHRDCIKFRWQFEKLLKLFNNNFKVISSSL